MYTGAALSFGLIRACRSGLVLCCSVLSDAGGENDGSSAIFERSLLRVHINVLSSTFLCLSMIPLCIPHWGRVTHICVGELTVIVSDNGLSPGRRQAIIWTNAGILLIGSNLTNFSEILIEILTYSFTKMSLKVSSAKWRPFCLGLNVIPDEIIQYGWWKARNLTHLKGVA